MDSFGNRFWESGHFTLAIWSRSGSHDPAESQFSFELWRVKGADPFVALPKQDCDVSLGGKAWWKDSARCFQRLLQSADLEEWRKGWMADVLGNAFVALLWPRGQMQNYGLLN